MGAAPVDIRGAKVETPQGVQLQLVRNGGGSTLAGGDLVEWMSADPSVRDVQRNSTNNNRAIAGVVDHVYAENGKTIAIGDLFWVVKNGPAYVTSSGITIAKGDELAPLAAACIDAASAAASRAAVGVALETQPSTAKSTLAYIDIP